jgi:hypothetical protein
MDMKTQFIRTYGLKKAVQRGKFIIMNTYIKRTEKFQINDLMLYLKLLEKQEQAKSKTSRRKQQYKESTKQKAGSLTK